MITKFKGVQWKAYTRKRNHEVRVQSELINHNNLLLDEIDHEQQDLEEEVQ